MVLTSANEYVACFLGNKLSSNFNSFPSMDENHNSETINFI